MITDETVMGKIYLVRNRRVMIDRDLAELYGVETKRLKEAVRRNTPRFPEDFMFEMDQGDFQNWRTQIASSNSEGLLKGLQAVLLYRAGRYHAILLLVRPAQ